VAAPQQAPVPQQVIYQSFQPAPDAGTGSATTGGKRKARTCCPGFCIDDSYNLDGSLFAGGCLGLSYGPVGGAYLEAGEAADADVFAEFGDLRGDELADGL
jgi:hypothetical protein